MRDLKSDLEICEKATPGGWKVDDSPNCSYINCIIYSDQYPVAVVKTPRDEQGFPVDSNIRDNNAIFISSARTGWPEAIERAIKAEEELEKQIKYHVERTDEHTEIISRLNKKNRAVGEQNATLREENDQQRDSIQQLSAQVAEQNTLYRGAIHSVEKIILDNTVSFTELQEHIDKYTTFTLKNNPGAEIMERMKKLEAVAEAAKELLNLPTTSSHIGTWEGIILHDDILERMSDALAALEGDRP